MKPRHTEIPGAIVSRALTMQQALAHAEDLRLDTESRIICKGSALLRFEYLNWNLYPELKKEKLPDPKRVERLKRIFREQGCRPLYVRHHIPAVVDQHQLSVALEDARRKGKWKTGTLPSNVANINTQNGYPELEFPGGIECLHGLHRIQAGKEWLPPTEKWWIVDLYLSGISYELKTLLVEEYANEEKPCDGEIYRKIWEYKLLPGEANSKVSPTTYLSFEMRWWACFHKSREKKLRSFFRNPTLPTGFTALARIPGLFDAGMMVTTLHKIMAMKCPEPILQYLEQTWRAWDGFLKGIERGLQRVDKVTVRALELRAPGASTLDAQFLHGQVLGGAIFSGFSAQERASIWENIRTFKGIIPSLFKFFQDVHFLQACVDGLKWLVTVPRDETVYTALEHWYKGNGETQLIQTTETTFELVSASSTLGKRLGFLQLIAMAMRHHQNLPKAPVKKNLKTIPRAKVDQELLQQSAALAFQLGFESPEIMALKGDLDPLPILITQKEKPLLVTTGLGESIKQRCGLPHTNTFEKDRNYLFLHNLCEERNEASEGITSFFVLKSWFAAFFDPPQWIRPVWSTESPNPAPPQVHHRYKDELDVNMGDSRPQSPNQREHEQDLQMIDTNNRTPATIQSVQQRMSSIAKEDNRMLEMKQNDELFVPREPKTSSQDAESGNVTVIRFVEGNESDMLNPLQEYGEVLALKVDRGDPTSLVKQQVQEFLCIGKRTCDRYKKIIPAEECYGVATREENKNTLFLIPDIGLPREVEEQGYETPKGGDQAMEDLSAHKTSQEIIHEQGMKQTQDRKAPEGEYPITEGLKNYGAARQETLDEDDNDLLDKKEENLHNARILDSDTVVIHLKKRGEDGHDNSKPAKDWEWTELMPLEVPIGDPRGTVERRLKAIFKDGLLEPYTSHLRKLQFKDCYNAAMADEDHTLYLIKPLWIPSNFVPTKAFPPTLASLEQFSREAGRRRREEGPNRRKIFASPHAKEGTGLKLTTFSFAPPDNPEVSLPFTSPKELVQSKAETHRDKIGRGADRPVTDDEKQNRIGMSFKENENEIEIRRKEEHSMRKTISTPVQ